MSRKSTRKPKQAENPMEERPFLRRLYLAFREVFIGTKREDVDFYLAPHRMKEAMGKMPEHIRTEPLGRDGREEPWFLDVVLGLYELLTRTYVEEDDQDTIWRILARTPDNDFKKFMRLANVRHNPNAISRSMAMQVLYEIAKHGQSRWIHCYQCQRGAKWRINQLIRSGKFQAPLVV